MLIFLIFLASSQVVMGNHGDSDDPLDWLRDSIPGEPGVDYPIFAEIQETSFSCENRVFGGYYADIEMNCQGYHVCLSDSVNARKWSFLCPNGTIFNQPLLTCDWWFNVDCTSAESEYGVNERIGTEESLSTENRQPVQQRPQQRRPVQPSPPRQQPQPIQPSPPRRQPVPVPQNPTTQRQPVQTTLPEVEAPEKVTLELNPVSPTQPRPNRRRPRPTEAPYSASPKQPEAVEQRPRPSPRPRPRGQSNRASQGQVQPAQPVTTNPFLPKITEAIVTYDATLDDDADVPVLFADPFSDIKQPKTPSGLYDVPGQALL